MSDELSTEDYPLAEKRPDLVRTAGGKTLDQLTVAAVVSGDVQLNDLAITPGALRQQAAIARAAGRKTLAANFERAAEMVDLPQELILSVYEKLRPGRAKDQAELIALAAALRRDHGAEKLASFVEEAAGVYERRGLFSLRFYRTMLQKPAGWIRLAFPLFRWCRRR
jgi:propanediol dehydratase small subunit